MLDINRGAINAIALFPDQSRVALALEDQSVQVVDLLTGDAALLGMAALPFLAVAVANNGTHVLAGGYDDGVQLFDVSREESVHGDTFPDQVYSIAILPDGNRALVGTHSTDILVWDLGSGRVTGQLSGHRGMVSSVVALPNHRALSTGDDGTLRLWDVSTSSALRIVDTGTEPGLAIVMHLDGRTAISAHGDTIRIWNIENGVEIRRIEGHTGTVATLAILPNGERLLSGSEDGTLRVWDIRTGTQLALFEGHSAAVTGAVIQADGSRAISSSVDGTIRFWDLSRIEILHDLDPGYTTARVALLGDSGVGKTGLGWRIAKGTFKEQASTHGQQFWVVDQLRKTRSDGVQCDAVLWDLAGQPDYRLVHALFLDQMDVGLLLFDPANRERPLSGVEYWLRQLHAPSDVDSTVHVSQELLKSTRPMLHSIC